MENKIEEKIEKPAFRSGFIAIGALIIILAGLGLGTNSTLATSCDSMCFASNLSLSLGGVLLFLALVNYTQSDRGISVGIISILLSVILITVDYIGLVGSRALLIGSMFSLVGGIFSLMAARR